MRSSGILMHITSLPSPYGIGTFGKEAYDFVDFLKKAGQSYWQVLPFGPTSFGDSPYQTFSAFAGNPYFIDFRILEEEGLLKKTDYKHLKQLKISDVNYEFIYKTKFSVLRIAFNNYLKNNNLDNFNNFNQDNQEWLDDYALFMAIKSISPKENWLSWDDEYKYRKTDAIISFKKTNNLDILFWKFLQFKFFDQFLKLKVYANQNGIEIIGDMAIYVAFDSSDCWSKPYYFQLDEQLLPTAVAGVPPDQFTSTGQLWGNPLYRYDVMKEDNYNWWVKRIKHSFTLFDLVRIDHFRGFEAYYSIPFTATTAINGKWVKGPGYELFQRVKEVLGDVRIIAEDLGFLTPEVYDLLAKCGYPGMKILQFGFEPLVDSEHATHNHPKNSVVYPGTHDNQTLLGWVDELDEKHLLYIMEYVGTKSKKALPRLMIKEAFRSPADYCIISMQDHLNLGECARFNFPATTTNNWVWRYKSKTYPASLIDKISKLTICYKRAK